jgi:hypothetical protein
MVMINRKTDNRRITTMNLQLPKEIETYFQASNTYDSNLLSSCFTEDAILYDEGSVYHGSTAIGAFIVKANRDLLAKNEITNVVVKEKETVVTATTSGNFEGSPVALDFHFTMKDQKIDTLKIDLAGE